MPYTPTHIANHMLDKADEEARLVSPMKLLKLVYMGYGWALAVLDRKVFEEPIYAWPHGPVIKSLYDEFKHWGSNPIEAHAIDFDLETGKTVAPRIAADDNDLNLVLNKVWDIYKHFSASGLRNITHEKGSPWDQVYKEGVRNIVIPDSLIKEHFSLKIRQYLANARGPAGRQ